MNTIRLSDPFPRGAASRKLEWGSSEWAADSCLVEWSTLEREWLGEPPVAPARPSARATASQAAPFMSGAVLLAMLVAVVGWWALS